MIAEPYIQVKTGTISWKFAHPDGLLYEMSPRYDSCDLLCSLSEWWTPYADFEREKLVQFSEKRSPSNDGGNSNYVIWSIEVDEWIGYRLWKYDSRSLIDYTGTSFGEDSESSRLLKRAEFLKAVCEKERVEWLPIDANLSEELQREEPKPECGYGRKRSMKQRGENGEWVTVEIQQNHCSAPRPEKCYCPVGYDLRDRIAKEKAKKFADCLMEPKKSEKCNCICHGAIAGDKSCAVQCAYCCPRDYYTKEEVDLLIAKNILTYQSK